MIKKVLISLIGVIPLISYEPSLDLPCESGYVHDKWAYAYKGLYGPSFELWKREVAWDRNPTFQAQVMGIMFKEFLKWRRGERCCESLMLQLEDILRWEYGLTD